MDRGTKCPSCGRDRDAPDSSGKNAGQTPEDSGNRAYYRETGDDAREPGAHYYEHVALEEKVFEPGRLREIAGMSEWNGFLTIVRLRIEPIVEEGRPSEYDISANVAVGAWRVPSDQVRLVPGFGLILQRPPRVTAGMSIFVGLLQHMPGAPALRIAGLAEIRLL